MGSETDGALESDRGNLYLAVLDERGTLLAQQALTAWSEGGARDPHLAVQDDVLLVVAEVDGEVMAVSVSLDLVALSTDEPGPVARAGADRSSLVGETFEVDGSDSYDPDDDVLTYDWRLIDQPSGGGLEAGDLTGADAPRASLIPPVVGTYELLLTVRSADGEDSDSVVVSVVESLDTGRAGGSLVADAGVDQVVYLGDEAVADGSASYAPGGEPQSWQWSLVSIPNGSGLTDEDLEGATLAQVSLRPDLEGVYDLSLVVRDGGMLASDQVRVTALTREGQACDGCAGTGGRLVPWWLLLAGFGLVSLRRVRGRVRASLRPIVSRRM
jgi:hypothetical protein